MIKEIARHSIIYVGLEALNKSIPFILLPVLTFYLLPSDMGYLGQFTALIGIMGVMVGLSTHGAVSVAYFREDREYLNTFVFNVVLILLSTTIAAILLIILFWNQLETLVNIPVKWFIIAALACCGQFLTLVNLVLWQARKEPLKYGIYQIVISLVYFVSAYSSVRFFQLSWQGVAASFASVYIFFGLVSLGFLYLRGFVRSVPNKELATDALKFGLPLVPHALAGWFFLGFNIFLTQKVLGDEMAGLMNVAMQFSLMVNVIALAVNRAYMPIVFGYLKDPTEKIKRNLVKLSYLGFVAMGFIGGSILLFVKLAFPWLVAPEYLKAIDIIPTLMIAGTINACYFFVSVFIFYEKRTGALAVTTFLAAFAHVFLSFYLIRIMGIQGVAISLLTVSIFRFFLVWILSARIYKLPWLIWGRSQVL